MTLQRSERLLYRGQEYRLLVEPLSPFLDKKHPRIRLNWGTNCYRGYVASWEITESKLYLLDIETSPKNLPITDNSLADHPKGQREPPASLKEVFFPETCGSIIFANWYSGTLLCPTGASTVPTSDHPTTLYDSYLYFHILCGDVQDEQILSLKEIEEKNITVPSIYGFL